MISIILCTDLPLPSFLRSFVFSGNLLAIYNGVISSRYLEREIEKEISIVFWRGGFELLLRSKDNFREEIVEAKILVEMSLFGGRGRR